MFVLILGRVLHGLGGGGLTSTGMVVLGDIAAPKDRGKYYGYFSVDLHHRRRLRAGARRRHRRISALVGDLLDEHPARPDRDGADARRCCAGCRGTSGRTGSTSSARSLVMAASVVVHAGAQHGRRELSVDCRRRSSRCSRRRSCSASPSSCGCAPRPSRSSRSRSSATARRGSSVIANAFGWAPIVGLHIFLPIYLQNIVGMAPADARA